MTISRRKYKNWLLGQLPQLAESVLIMLNVLRIDFV